MDRIDFGYIGKNGASIYISCFQPYAQARFVLKKSESEWKNLVAKTETVFHFLVEEGNKRGFDVDSILEIPTSTGSTCFNIASGCSKKISTYIIEREIKVNTITATMLVPPFIFPDLAVPMMKKGINPHVIANNGASSVDSLPASFKSKEAKQLLATFPRSIHFSIEDINCEKTCPSDCLSRFKSFYFKNGELVEMTDTNRIGQGGFGCVFKGLFHGEEKAMKCVWTGGIEERIEAQDEVLDLEKNISEIRIQIASGGSGIIVPEAFVRQQNQERDDNGNWIGENYNIYIYSLYDCNLYELHQNHFDQFNDEIMIDVLQQCLTRICSNLTE